MHAATSLLIILAAGLLSQWLAWRIGLPAIVVLIAAGLALGPVTGTIALGIPQGELTELVGLGVALKKIEIDVLMVDGAYHRLRDARMAGLDTYYGEILSEHAEHTLETQHLSHVLCATENDFYNALVCKAVGPKFGRHRTFQLATPQAPGEELWHLTLQQRGYFAFDPGASFDVLHQRLSEGWTVQATRLSAQFGWAELTDRLGTPLEQWILLGALTPAGAFRLYSKEQHFKLAAGWTAIYFAPGRSREG